MRVGLPTGVVQTSVDETITGLWTFINALGFLTDIITERTVAAGVTVDGLLIKDSGIPAAAVTAHQAALSLLFTQLTDSIAAGQVPVGAVTQHQAALSLLFTQLTDSIADAQVPVGAVTQHQAALAIAFAQLTSQIADAQVPASAVTQHQAALSLLFTQLTDSIAAGQVPVGAVTQHEAALAILESQIADGSILARLAASESIAGLWEFAHVSGLKTDVIKERTGGAGVTIDGSSKIIDGRFESTSGTAAEGAFDAIVSGDSDKRWTVNADGLTKWGPGNAVVDTELYRSGVGELKTTDDFIVGGKLDLAGDIEMSGRDMTLSGAGTDDDVATGTVTVQRLNPNSTNNISGLAGGRAGRMIVIVNIVAEDLILQSQAVASAAANRMILPGGGDLTLGVNDALWLWYDGTTSRWRGLAPNP